MSTTEFVTHGRFAVGYVKPLNKPVQPILGRVVRGYVVVQGCIILGTEQQMQEIGERVRENPQLLEDPNLTLEGTVIEGHGVRWPGGQVIYEVDPALTDRDRISKAIAEWESKTAVRFKLRTDETDVVAFVPVDSGCASAVGHRGGRQEVWLSPSCTTGNVIHEIGHTLGLWHEQSRIDRDSFVEILWSNINPMARSNFDQHIDDGRDVGTYDFGSIMHYPERAFSVNNEPTIRSRAPLPPGIVLGQRKCLSAGDIATVKAIYP